MESLVLLVALLPQLPAADEWPLHQGFPNAHAVCGDLDGDGARDLLFAAHKSEAVHAYSARTGKVLFTVMDLGCGSLAGLGDVDGDGVPDFAAGAIDGAHIRSGKDGRLVDRLDPCESAGEFLTVFEVAAIPDSDGDGLPELALEHLQHDEGLVSWHVHVISLPEKKELFRTEHERDPWIVGLPDLNGDGAGELACTETTGADYRPTSHVYSGRDGQLLHDLSSRTGELWITAENVAAQDDMDGDGLRELVIGSGGSVMICSGKTGRVLQEVREPDAIYTFGTAVAAGTDVDGDGIADLLVAQYEDNEDENFVTANGQAWLYSGADGSTLHTVSAAGLTDFGSFAAFLDDLDGDGAPEFLVGGRPLHAGPGPWPRPVHVYSGRTGLMLYALP